MTIEPCTCSPVPVVSSLEKRPGAVLKDFTDAAGRWHAVVLNYDPNTNTGDVRKQSLVAPSAAWQAAHPVPTLAQTQATMAGLIDTEATKRIANGPGFEFPAASGQFFSLTLAAQTKWNGLYAARASLTYPLLVRTKDDLLELSVANATTLEAMHAASVAAVRVLLDEARVAKRNVMGAVDRAGAVAAAQAYLP